MKERQQPGQQAQQQRVDDQREQAEREDEQRQRDEHQDGPDERVQNPQQKRGHQQVLQLVAIADVVAQNDDGQQHRDGVDDPALQKPDGISGLRIHGQNQPQDAARRG